MKFQTTPSVLVREGEISFQLKEVTKTYGVRKGQRFHAVEGVTFNFQRGTAYGIVGESGSGKTTLGRMLAGMLEATRGEILLEGRDIRHWVRQDRGRFCRKVQMIFQNPYASLDPRWRVETLLEEGIQELPRALRRKKTEEAMECVCLPRGFLGKRPNALSGGERQRVAVARSLVMEPEFLILDEPTSQLDVATQAEMMKLFGALKSRLRGGLILITHDLALASHLADALIIFRHGKVLEQGPKREVFSSKVGYVQDLVKAVPRWPPRWD